jgi:hypothetical protein
MTERAKESILRMLKEYVVKHTRDKFTKGLSDSLFLKNKLLKKGEDVGRIPEHIKLAHEILDFISEYEMEERDKKINSLFERKILSFYEYKKRV